MKNLHPRFSLTMIFGALLAVGCASKQQAFDTPQQAADALIVAVRTGDPDDLDRILGKDSYDLLASGDDVADRLAADKFVQAYERKHELTGTQGEMTLLVGENDWPLPFPIVRSEKDGKWTFDALSGSEEIVNRRVGRNELNVIEVCKAIVDAQREFAIRDLDGDGIAEYAAKVLSDPGQHNGLYWPVKEGETPSPLGELVAAAMEEGYRKSGQSPEHPQPYHGYYYRMLFAQGPHAQGGEQSYLINGKLIGGFAVVAYPAEYGSSGVMSFIVNHTGVVHQKDLGTESASIAKAMNAYDPGEGWQPAVSTAE